jgi:gp44
VTGFTHERPGEGETNEWYTPKTFFAQLGEHVTFGLDPCSPGVGLSHVPARRVFTKDDDGLAQQWEGLVFCNPPYGRDVGLWAEKCAAHGNSMALVFARVDTAWFQNAVATADGVFFLAGRVKFHKGSIRNPNKGNASAGSCLILWGEEAMRIVENSDLPGVLMKPAAPASAGE